MFVQVNFALVELCLTERRPSIMHFEIHSYSSNEPACQEPIHEPRSNQPIGLDGCKRLFVDIDSASLVDIDLASLPALLLYKDIILHHENHFRCWQRRLSPHIVTDWKLLSWKTASLCGGRLVGSINDYLLTLPSLGIVSCVVVIQRSQQNNNSTWKGSRRQIAERCRKWDSSHLTRHIGGLGPGSFAAACVEKSCTTAALDLILNTLAIRGWVC